MDRNIRLYPVYQGLWNSLFWMPVFFLYFSSVLTPARVLQLEAIYYLSVVLLEVPSGYFSDRVGRRATLIISATCWASASAVFALTSGFEPFIVAQVLLAAGMAFNSGTDSSLLYDSLAAVGREEEYAFHEGRGQAIGFYAGAATALLGGLFAGFDLRLAYAASAVTGYLAVVVAFRFTEPTTEEAHVLPPLSQVVDAFRRLRDPVLMWIFAFAVAMTVFNHVPYEFFQPWVDLLLVQQNAQFEVTPVVTGVLVALTMFVSALASRRAVAVRDRLGTPGTLLATLALQGLVMVGMALWLHPLVVLLILLRGMPRAIAKPVQNAAVHPRLHQGIRATFLSVQSLAGRLAFSGSLLLASFAVPHLDELTHPAMAEILHGFAIAAAAVFGVLLLAGRAFAVTPGGAEPDRDSTATDDADPGEPTEAR